MEEDEDRKTKKIRVDITHQEVNVGEANSVFVYNISLQSDIGVWEEPATSKEHMEAIIRGINMALSMIGVHGGIPTSISTPFSTEITCYKGHICRGF